VGSTLWIDDEEMLDAITAISGSGPAYVFYFIEAMQQAAYELGLDEAQARQVVLDTFIGASKMAEQSHEDAVTLRARVTSKNGTTERALLSMEANQVKMYIVPFMRQRRAREMGDELGEDSCWPRCSRFARRTVQPFAALLLFRFHAVWLHAPMRNPIGNSSWRSDFIVLRARRIARPGLVALRCCRHLWSSSSISAFLGWGYPFETFPLVGLLAWTAVKLLKISIYLLVATLIAEALLSWINPRTPLAPMLLAVNRPFLQPLRSKIPLVGNVDLSVLILLIICQLILIVPIGGLEQAVMRLI
jgi:uncharacterized protein YggT (Ycf19 family)